MALDCDAAAASEATFPVEFISSRGTNLPLGEYSSGVCYTQVTTPGTSQTVMKPLFPWASGIPIIGDLLGGIRVPVTINKPGTTTTHGNGWSLSPFNVEARGKARVWWRDDGHLMLTITDLYSTLTGTAGDTGKTFQAPLYSGPVGWAMTAGVSIGAPQGVPADNHPNWKFCLGGWWSALMSGCGEACPDAYGNPGGGTMYWWNKWTGTDVKFAQNGNTPGRMDGPLEWDLGEIEPREDLQVFIYARGVRGRCGSQYFDPKMGARQSLAFAVPLPALCPPEITGVAMRRDICEEKVWADVSLSIPALGGNNDATLTLEYSTDNFVHVETITQTVSASSSVTITTGKLYPNTRYCFRAKLGTSKVESEWSEVECQTTLFFPRSDWIVPELTQEECEAMTEGDCIDEFTENTPGLEHCKGDE